MLKPKQNVRRNKSFKLNLKSASTQRYREKNKYELMLDELNKLKEDTEMKKLLAGFPLSKVRKLKLEI